MIVPQNKLLRLTAITLLPATLAAAAVPALELPLLATALAVLLGVCLLDALWVVRLSGGLRVDFPEQVNVAKGREEKLSFSVRDEKRALRSLVLALGLPAEVTSPWRHFPVALPSAGAPGLRIEWPINARRRGELALSGCYFRIPSRLGLWFKQGSLPASTRVRVYPNLRREYKMLASSILHRGEAGLHALRQVGQGRDFEKLRDYFPGDSLSDVHWRVTAKRGRLVTKEYQIERTREVYVLIDASRLSTRYVDSGLDSDSKGADPPDGAQMEEQTEGWSGRSREPLLERYITAALTLGDIAGRRGDKFGLLTFDNRIVSFIRAGMGRAHFRACMDTLFGFHAAFTTPDFEEVATFILQNLRRRALLLFLTSLDDPALAESFVQSMSPVGRRHIVLVNMVRPAQARPAFSDQSVGEPDDLYRALGGHLLWQSLRELESVLRRCGIGFSLMSHEKLCTDMVSQYLAVKRRQIL